MSYPVSFPSSNPLVTVTHPSPSTWVIEMHNGEDNRLTDVFITKALNPALDAVEKHWRENWRAGVAKKDGGLCTGAVIIVGNRKQDKFFSNGLDFATATKDPTFKTNFFPLTFNPMLHRLVTFPIPVIAAINGHSFAGGMILALACDYRVMTDGSKRNAWMCMNEIHFGATIPHSLIAVLKAKVPSPQTLRKIVVEGHRFTPGEALALGLVDHVVDGTTEAVITAAQAFGDKLGPMAKTGAWGVNKRVLYRDVIGAMTSEVQVGVDVLADDAAAKARL
ncbi:ClpP/crotonase [Daedaleopsis nitida]|nr:ClpP/crotonase [Daedaleopsis nitida]